MQAIQNNSTRQPLNTIAQGDCIEVMRQMPANSVDFILTDPPYLVNYRDRDGRTIQNDANADWLKPAMKEAYRVLKQNRVAVVSSDAGGVPEVRSWCRSLVQPDEADTERSAASHSQRASGRSREVQLYRLAHVPPHVSFVAGRDRSAHEGATGTDASCLDPDDDERLWTGHVVIEERSEWEGRGDGAQANESERLKP
jgi:hypothetical protein